MPCFDKKLEASREEFTMMESKEVDCVITTSNNYCWPSQNIYTFNHHTIFLSVEIDDHFQTEGIRLQNFPSSALDSELSLSQHLESFTGSGSGGFAHHVFQYAAKELHGIEMENLEWKALR